MDQWRDFTVQEQQMCIINETKGIGVFVMKNGKECCMVVCPGCGLPRFADYECDACAKRELEDALQVILEPNTKMQILAQYGIKIP